MKATRLLLAMLALLLLVWGIQQITGERLDWRRYTSSQAYDLRRSAEETRRIQQITGEALDWKRYDSSQAYDMRRSAEIIAEINRRTSSNYRWQDYSSSDAYNLKTRLGL